MDVGKKLYLIPAVAALGAFLLVVPANAQQETNPDHFTVNGVEAFPGTSNALAAHPAKPAQVRANAQRGKGNVIALARSGAKPALPRASGAAKRPRSRKEAAMPERTATPAPRK